tara:strand:+ start:3351 stop:4556 length:1206 start_codon:yes stop_codon:yes gene_type:complete
MLRDFLYLTIKCGSGGSGAIDYKNHVEQSQPLGGTGGDGGSVYLLVSDDIHDLSHLDSTKLLSTKAGGDGGKNLKKGEKGEDIVIKVPPGTRVKDSNDELIADLVNMDSLYLLSKGGEGGRGNFELKGKVNTSPKFAESGVKGYKEKYKLDLGLLSDIAIIGLPNVGKSSFLRLVTNSNAEVADYPFTTKSPNIGVIKPETMKLKVVDLPGLIGKASEGKGLGKKILKHLLGARIILYILDPSPTQELGIEEQRNLLDRELESYDQSISKIQKIVLVNKIDLFPNKTFGDYLHLSSKEGTGLEDFYNLIENEIVFKNVQRGHFELTKPIFYSHSVHKENDVWIIEGTEIDKMCDLVGSIEEVNNEIMRRFESSELEKKLISLGIKSGETIKLNNKEFLFQD